MKLRGISLTIILIGLILYITSMTFIDWDPVTITERIPEPIGGTVRLSYLTQARKINLSILADGNISVKLYRYDIYGNLIDSRSLDVDGEEYLAFSQENKMVYIIEVTKEADIGVLINLISYDVDQDVIKVSRYLIYIGLALLVLSELISRKLSKEF